MQPERTERVKKKKVGQLSPKEALVTSQILMTRAYLHLSALSLLPQQQTELYVPDVPLTSHWVAALWQKQTNKYFLFTHLYFLSFIYRVFFLHLYKLWLIWEEIKEFIFFSLLSLWLISNQSCHYSSEEVHIYICDELQVHIELCDDPHEGPS